MDKYSLIKIDAVKGKCKFYKLMQEGFCWFDDFEINLERQYHSEIATIYKYMDKVAMNETLPKTKFKKINKGEKDLAEYEFKTKHLRVYCIHSPETGKIIILGGYKNTQSKDITRFKNIKENYLEYIENDKRRIIKK